ncbi:MAG: SdpI family protein [Candidatus Falkowbacteria bacterium]|nr:SdpI family protein [Candidatus Falkowbacteria bacterium]
MNPVKPSWKTDWLPIVLIGISIGVGSYLQVYLPNLVPSHWGFNGEVDGYSSRTFGAWFVPALMIGIYLLFLALPYFDPKKEHYANFVEAYHGLKNLMVTFFFVTYILISATGLGFDIPVGSLMPVGIGLLFIGIGYFIKSVKQNWAIGVRTPWTMESPTVWKRTNELMARLMLLGGVLLTLCAFPIEDIYKATLLIITIVVIAVVPIVYSYFIYRAEQKGKKKK